jgi:uncharacterized membrane protein YczE
VAPPRDIPPDDPAQDPADDPTAGPANDRLGLRRMSPAQQLRAGRLPRRLVQLFVGLSVFGLSMAMLIQAGRGMIPWDVLHYGLAEHLPLSFGTIVIVVALAVLLLWIPLREMPGLGTLSNAIWVGIAADFSLSVLPAPEDLPWQLLLMTVGIVLNAAATAMYIGAQLGPGPRDGLMTGLARISPLSLRVIRTGIEIAVVLIGWLLGGVVGVGTVLFALTIGPLTQFFLPPLVVRLPHPPR